MDVKEAVAKAKTYVAEAFAGESLTNLGLEEVRFDDTADAWSITLGFSRPWDAPNIVTNRLGRDLDLNRIYTRPCESRTPTEGCSRWTTGCR